MTEFLKNIEQQLVINDLQARYAACIDEDRLEEWPGFFTAECLYKITNAEDFAAGRPMGVIYATSQDMLRDRITSLRTANIYEKQRYRHILSPARVDRRKDGALLVTTGFLLIRIMATGETTIFMSGVYHDIIVAPGKDAPAGDGWAFREKIVVADSATIDTLLAIPV